MIENDPAHKFTDRPVQEERLAQPNLSPRRAS